jgi:hypothetical protein
MSAAASARHSFNPFGSVKILSSRSLVYSSLKIQSWLPHPTPREMPLCAVHADSTMVWGFPRDTTSLCVSPSFPDQIFILMISPSRDFWRCTFGLHSCSISVFELQRSLLQRRRSSAWRMLLVYSISKVQDWDYTSSEHYSS